MSCESSFGLFDVPWQYEQHLDLCWPLVLDPPSGHRHLLDLSHRIDGAYCSLIDQRDLHSREASIPSERVTDLRSPKRPLHLHEDY